MIPTADYAEIDEKFHSAGAWGRTVWFPIEFYATDRNNQRCLFREYVKFYFRGTQYLVGEVISPQTIPEDRFGKKLWSVTGITVAQKDGADFFDGHWVKDGQHQSFVCNVTLHTKPMYVTNSLPACSFLQYFSINDGKKLIEEYCANPENASKDLYFLGTRDDSMEIFKLPVSMAFDELFERLINRSPNGKNSSKFKLQVGGDGKMADCVIEVQ